MKVNPWPEHPTATMDMGISSLGMRQANHWLKCPLITSQAEWSNTAASEVTLVARANNMRPEALIGYYVWFHVNECRITCETRAENKNN